MAQTRSHPEADRRRPARVGQLGLTAMIDLIFLLLIFFVVTASFVIDEGVLVAKLPGPAPHHPAELAQPIAIELTSVGQAGVAIRINGQRLESFAALTDYLIRMQDNHAAGRAGVLKTDHPITIRPGQGVRWQHVINAYNCGRSADYTNIQFTQPLTES